MSKPKERPKILELVKKLHSKAENAKQLGSTKEAEAFAAHVARMMDEHLISMDELELTELNRLEPVGEGEAIRPAGYKSKRVPWVEILANTIARAHYCKTLVVTGTSVVVLVGRQSDRDIAEWMINWMTPWLWSTSFREMKRARVREKKAGNYFGARGYRNSFISGFINGLARRYEEERATRIKEAEARGTSHALVRVDTRLQEVIDWVDANVKGKVKGVSLRASNRSGFAAGEQAAREINLNRPVGEGQKVKGLIG